MTPHHLKKAAASPTTGALILLAASLLGLALANSPWSEPYFNTLHTETAPHPFTRSVQDWINDGLMALFFLSVTIEIKHEITTGHLSSLRRVALPLLGAIGGMIVPALLYALRTRHDPIALNGWAIPVATDAAFALAIVTALGSRIPPGIRAFLMALAIFDDVLGIIVIALFYGTTLAWPALAIATLLLLTLILLNKTGATHPIAYLAPGLLLWLALLPSGLHPTLAGVALGLCLPTHGRAFKRLTTTLQPVVALLVLPVFGCANVGLSLHSMTWHTLLTPAATGATLGLLLGKPAGVFGTILLTSRLNIAHLPHGATYRTLFGCSLLCGIGFTISLFIAALAFTDTTTLTQAKLGIFTGSLLAALVGWLWLRLTPSP